MEQRHVTAIILAAGSGSRMGSKITKQRISIHGESLLKRSVKAFSGCEKITDIILVCRSDEIDWARGEISSFPKVSAVISGGKTRAESAKIGFSYISENAEYVAIVYVYHDRLSGT